MVLCTRHAPRQQFNHLKRFVLHIQTCLIWQLHCNLECFSLTFVSAVLLRDVIENRKFQDNSLKDSKSWEISLEWSGFISSRLRSGCRESHHLDYFFGKCCRNFNRAFAFLWFLRSSGSVVDAGICIQWSSLEIRSVRIAIFDRVVLIILSRKLLALKYLYNVLFLQVIPFFDIRRFEHQWRFQPNSPAMSIKEDEKEA